jgi:hypothetical protein
MNVDKALAERIWSHNNPTWEDQQGKTMNQNGIIGNSLDHLAIPNNTVNENPTEITTYNG